MFDDENEPKSTKSDQIIVGEDLSALSINELTMRVNALHSEIARVESAIEEKKGQASEAEDLFK